MEGRALHDSEARTGEDSGCGLIGRVPTLSQPTAAGKETTDLRGTSGIGGGTNRLRPLGRSSVASEGRARPPGPSVAAGPRRGHTDPPSPPGRGAEFADPLGIYEASFGLYSM